MNNGWNIPATALDPMSGISISGEIISLVDSLLNKNHLNFEFCLIHHT
jgi:hypothetical protein